MFSPVSAIRLLVIVFAASQTIVDVQAQDGYCITPDQEDGTCVLMPECPYLVQLFAEQPRTSEIVNYVVASQTRCGRRAVERTPIVCCAEPATQPDNADTGDETQPEAQPEEPPVDELPADEVRIGDGDTCRAPDFRNGVCTPIRKCPIIIAELQQHSTSPDYSEYLRNSNGICSYQTEVICCPPAGSKGWNQQTPAIQPPAQTSATSSTTRTSVPHLLTVAEKCGVSKNVVYTKVIGGVEANPGSLPWMALIGYTDKSGELGWKCGGSLISSRHILTAAHCILSTLSTVRLGEHDVSKPSATAFNVNIVKVARYPDYDAKDGHGDLAVLYLERDVPFSDAVRPVCLPLEEPVRSKNFVGYNPFVAGWGRTTEGGRPSNTLQQLQLPVLENSLCQAKYKAINKLISTKQFDNAVLCAGELSGGKDSCQGDSGGPLVQPVQAGGAPNFYQIGIVSYGIGCARADVPGVYTRVQTFVDWIRDKVAE